MRKVLTCLCTHQQLEVAPLLLFWISDRVILFYFFETNINRKQKMIRKYSHNTQWPHESEKE